MHLHKACTTILDQLTDLVNQIKADDFNKPSVTLNGSTIGQHLRHTIEFFLCLEKGLDEGLVNYDNRDHDKAIENDKFIAHSMLTGISTSINKQVEDKELSLAVCYGLVEEERTTLPTSFRRELVYNIEHAVHHMAIMKIGIREIAPYVKLAHDFGIAASTIRHQNTNISISK